MTARRDSARMIGAAASVDQLICVKLPGPGGGSSGGGSSGGGSSGGGSSGGGSSGGGCSGGGSSGGGCSGGGCSGGGSTGAGGGKKFAAGTSCHRRSVGVRLNSFTPALPRRSAYSIRMSYFCPSTRSTSKK